MQDHNLGHAFTGNTVGFIHIFMLKIFYHVLSRHIARAYSAEKLLNDYANMYR